MADQVQSTGEAAGGGATTAATLYLQIMTALALTSDQTSALATDGVLIPYETIEVQVNVTSANTTDGVLKLQDSIDGSNWSDISGASISVTSGSTTNVFRLANSFCGRYIRLVWTHGTNSTGTISAFLYCK